MKNRLIRSLVSSVVAFFMALVFGGCIVTPINPQRAFGGAWGLSGGWQRPGVNLGNYANTLVVQPAYTQPGTVVGNPAATVGAQQASSNYAAAAIAGGQQTGPYIVGAHPTNPFGISQQVPLPGTLRMQTGCAGGTWFVPSTGTCSSTAWIPGVETVWVPNGGVANVQANQLGPGGGIQGVPGATMPMVPGGGVQGFNNGWGGPGFQGGFNQPIIQDPFFGGW